MAKRVRASSIKLFPAEADSDVAWALDQTVTRESMTQSAAVDELNERLQKRDLPQTTLSSFNRLVVQCRETGIPKRYQLGTKNAARNHDEEDPLVALIERCIEAALDRRGITRQKTS